MPLRITKRSRLSKALGLDVPSYRKYRAERTAVEQEGQQQRFDSRREANRWCELRMLERAGEIADLERQPVYPLLAPTPTAHVFVRIGEYRGDFRYTVVKTGGRVVEDAKGVRTPLYRWKRKHVEAQYGIQIQEV